MTSIRSSSRGYAPTFSNLISRLTNSGSSIWQTDDRDDGAGSPDEVDTPPSKPSRNTEIDLVLSLVMVKTESHYCGILYMDVFTSSTDKGALPFGFLRQQNWPTSARHLNRKVTLATGARLRWSKSCHPPSTFRTHETSTPQTRYWTAFSTLELGLYESAEEFLERFDPEIQDDRQVGSGFAGLRYLQILLHQRLRAQPFTLLPQTARPSSRQLIQIAKNSNRTQWGRDSSGQKIRRCRGRSRGRSRRREDAGSLRASSYLVVSAEHFPLMAVDTEAAAPRRLPAKPLPPQLLMCS
ncbi:hypothetical protein BJY52DRAFT_1226002 [Lactarius psammicola]|nr:hypothetical protein BJY52DRAFT_1227854 [Lactarius psammicola]KAI9452705.1 hypothetical protein BJY52DRAFT_1226002 [Lactarius psammicola]